MDIKEKIRSVWLGKYLISELHCVESKLVPVLIDDETAVKRYYKNCTGKELNLANPQTFSEKLNWYKLNDRQPLMQQCADKYAVREYVTSKGYGDCLNELYGVYDKVSDIDMDKLPEQFVLKAAHGSHMNIIVKDKKAVNWRQEKMMMRSWLRQNIYWSGREWVYKDVPKRIIAEKYLEDETGELKDYKFFCFNGKPCYLQFDGNRLSGKQYRNFYDMNMEVLPIIDTVPNNFKVPFPLTKDIFEKMKLMAEDLSEPFQFVRTDFYAVNSKIYFGELTFFDAGGQCNMEPEEWNSIWGNDWKIVDSRGGGTID